MDPSLLIFCLQLPKQPASVVFFTAPFCLFPIVVHVECRLHTSKMTTATLIVLVPMNNRVTCTHTVPTALVYNVYEIGFVFLAKASEHFRA